MSGSTFADALSDPGVNALLGLAQGFGQAALPTRMPTPLGAVLGAGAGGMQQGLRAGQGLQEGQNQILAGQMQNEVTKSGLPMILERNRTLANMWAHPEQMQQMMNGGPMPSASGAPVSTGGPLSGGAMPGAGSSDPSPGSAMPGNMFAQRVNGSENATGNPAQKNASGPGGAPTSTAVGNGQFIETTWLPLFKQLYPDIAKTMTEQQILDMRGQKSMPGVPDLSGDMTAAYAQQNAPILQAQDVPPTAANLAMAHRYGPGGAIAVAKANPQAPLSGILSPEAIKANPTWANQTAGQVRNNATMRYGTAPVDFSGVGGGQAGLPTPASALATAQQYEQQANLLDRQQNTAKWLQAQGMPVFAPPGDSAVLRAAAAKYRELALAGPTAQASASGKANVELATAGQIQAAKAANQAIDLRAGGLHWDPIKGWIKNPGIIETQDAAGNTVPMHATPPMPDAPPGMTGEATPIMGPNNQPVITKLAPQQQLGRDEAVKQFLGKDADSYIAAQNTQAWLNQIDHAADVMNKAGAAYQSGPFAPQRLALMGSINDVGRTLGMGHAFNPDAIASSEEMRKATTTAGFELSSHYEGHARQAAATIMNATSAVPGMANSPQGLQLVSAGIREGAQSAIDMHEYKQGIYNQTQGAGLERAETDFAQKYPAQMYANRAISTVQPPTLKATSLQDAQSQFEKYLPGTRVILNGQSKIVPPRPGAPPIPAYIQQRFMQPQAPPNGG